jgi:hypothetical protein
MGSRFVLKVEDHVRNVENEEESTGGRGGGHQSLHTRLIRYSCRQAHQQFVWRNVGIAGVGGKPVRAVAGTGNKGATAGGRAQRLAACVRFRH